MATPRRDSEAARVLADIHRLAQERVGLSSSLYALQQWQNVNPLKPVLGPWLLRVLARVLRNRKVSRLLARRYYNLSRAIAGGKALPNPQGPAYPPLVPLTRLLDDFGDVVDDITRGTVGRSREPRSARRSRADPNTPPDPIVRADTIRGRVDDVTDELDKALDVFEKKFKDILGVQVEVEDFLWPDPGEDRDFEKELQKEIQAELKRLEREIRQLERDREIEVIEFRQRAQDRARASGYRVSGAAQLSTAEPSDDELNDLINDDDLAIGWLRVTGSSPCSFCAMLASRGVQWMYKSKESALLTPRLGNSSENRRARAAADKGADIAFHKTHPNCFPAGTVVSGPPAEQATRRVFQGEVVILRTAAGHELTCTPNHPILTDIGWVPAYLLEEGDHVVRSLRADGANALNRPDENQVPALIEEVWSSHLVSGLTRVPVATKDFHGDGVEGEVEIVGSAGSLLVEDKAAFGQEVEEQGLLVGAEAGDLGPGAGPGDTLFNGARPTTDSLMRCTCHRTPLFRGGGPVTGELPLGAASEDDSMLSESLRDNSPRDAERLGERQNALAIPVSHDDLSSRKVVDAVPTRFDAPAGEMSPETFAGYAGKGVDLLRALAGEVDLDRVIEKRVVGFSDHVYNLTSSEGWYVANGLIVSNCQCSVMPVFNDTPIKSARDKYFEDNWGKATKGFSGRDALNAWRRWLAKQYAAGLVPDDEITKT